MRIISGTAVARGRSIVSIAIALVISIPMLFGQARPQTRVPQSELARQNMAQVSASVIQIVGILHSDPGLMVELKRWIAKDATDHGQLIAETDLSDEAILDRLENDISFRSEATGLLQKFGYLQPTVNPASQLAREQELVMRERVRLVAQQQQQDRTRNTQTQRTAQQNQVCDRSGDCTRQNVAPSTQNMTQQGGGQQPSEEQEPQLLPENPSTRPSVRTPQAPSTDITQELIRTSSEDPSLGESNDSDTIGNSSLYGQDSESDGSQGSSGSRRGGQSQNEGKSEFGDLSLNSDFSSDDLNPFANENSATRSTSVAAVGTEKNETKYDSGHNRSMASDRRAREAVTPDQRLVRRRNPYLEVPSLYDMYLQAAARPPAVERFGMPVFENGTRDMQMIPMDLPVGPEYVLGPGDGLSVNLWGGVSRRFHPVVDREGRVSLPEVGPVLVAGKSLAEVQESFQKTLRTEFRDVSVDVSLSRLRTVRVYVVGDVLRPGPYDVSSLSTPLNALFAAGGPTGRGSLRILKHFRGNQLVQEVDVYDLLLHGVKGDMQRLENGDSVLVRKAEAVSN